MGGGRSSHYWGQGCLIVDVPRSCADTPNLESSEREIGPSILLFHNTRRFRETDIHVHGGIRTRSPNKRAVADLRHRASIKALYKLTFLAVNLQ
jgi:hypothetical protein